MKMSIGAPGKRVEVVAKEKRTFLKGINLATMKNVAFSISRGQLTEFFRALVFPAHTGLPAEKPLGMLAERDGAGKLRVYTLFTHEKGVPLTEDNIRKMSGEEKNGLLTAVMNRVGKTHARLGIFKDFKLDNILYDAATGKMRFIDLEDATVIPPAWFGSAKGMREAQGLLADELARVLYLAVHHGLLNRDEKGLDRAFAAYAPHVRHLFQGLMVPARPLKWWERLLPAKKLPLRPINDEEIVGYIRQETLKKMLEYGRGSRR